MKRCILSVIIATITIDSKVNGDTVAKTDIYTKITCEKENKNMSKAMTISHKEDDSRVDIKMKIIYSAKDASFATNKPDGQLNIVRKNEEMRDENTQRTL